MKGESVMKLKKYIAYLDDGKSVYKIAVPAKDPKAVKEYLNGNGEVVAIKELNDWPISAEKVGNALKYANFGEIEIDLVVRALTLIGITE